MLNEHLPHDHGEIEEIEDLMNHLRAEGGFHSVADIFREVGDSTRLRIFWLLCHAEECVINISAMMEMSSPAVSHHLRSLRAAKLIVSRRDGKEVYYRAADTKEAALLHRAVEQMMEITCPGGEHHHD